MVYQSLRGYKLSEKYLQQRQEEGRKQKEKMLADHVEWYRVHGSSEEELKEIEEGYRKNLWL